MLKFTSFSQSWETLNLRNHDVNRVHAMFSDSIYWSALGRCRRCMTCHKRVERSLVMWHPALFISSTLVILSSESLRLQSTWSRLNRRETVCHGEERQKRRGRNGNKWQKMCEIRISSVGGLRWISQKPVKNTSRSHLETQSKGKI